MFSKLWWKSSTKHYNCMHEEFLHYLWQYKMYNNRSLKTQCGLHVEVIHPGTYNVNAGPDFFNAKIKIGDTLWAGNVEVHINASDWNEHKHQMDKAYDNVILHVVEKDDVPITRSNGQLIPVLKITYASRLLNEYLQLTNSNDWLACAAHLKEVSSFDISLWMQRMLIEKLEHKTMDIQRMLDLTIQNWDETFYRLLFRSFGFGVNGDPFELLAQSIPLKILLKYCDNRLLVEALLFGQAGFLEEVNEEGYVNHLVRDYRFLKDKHGLRPIEKHLWKFLRLRPSNFPTIRMAQLAALLIKLKGVFGMLINEPDIKRVNKFFEVEVSPYWQQHYTFQRKSCKKGKNIGIHSRNLIIINTIVPYLFAYGKLNGDNGYIQRSLDWLSGIRAEKNALLDQWVAKEISVNNAGDSQALIYLSKNYCKLKKCLRCRIGHQVLAIKNDA
ncbi:DUF2851 family protein [Saccharicrinis fermentans]|uniref:DUF2851 domain-containing protein n=1 Tax=Saccharicrinis fermentans DSM 9555 = JCM 21142 TaxID=869213 RepID=W7Y8D8_9BACT|nr:DUF2851 family protein [Saccharicrinis fermentans]GAF03953.1 hypothetical protein JCM21142_72643 [Saccharicrinis fermentans DSM 9555 = JCM 21142]